LNSRKGKPLYIIDGYNVIFSGQFRKRYSNIEEGRNYFIKLVDSYVSRKSVRIIIVWDGEIGIAPINNKRGSRIKVIYSIPPQNADQKIIETVEKMRGSGKVIVVSNDRRHIIGVVKNLGVSTMNVNQFLSLVDVKNKKNCRNIDYSSEKDEDITLEKEKVNDLSVNEWMRIFRNSKR